MIKHDLPSGAVLDITLLPYEQAWHIASLVLKEVEKLDVKFPSDLDFSDSEKFTSYILGNINDIKSPVCALLSSQKILEAAQSCFKKCLYNNQKIDAQTFESIDGRRDFLISAFYAIKENVSPFLEGLLSSLSAS